MIGRTTPTRHMTIEVGFTFKCFRFAADSIKDVAPGHYCCHIKTHNYGIAMAIYQGAAHYALIPLDEAEGIDELRSSAETSHQY